MLHLETINADTLELLKKLQSLDELSSTRLVGGTALASLEDIAAMKISAITNRGTKKDFIDLFFLLKKFSMNQIMEWYKQKYPDAVLFSTIKSLTYFDDAEHEPMPTMLCDCSWELIKEEIIKQVLQYKI